MISDPARYMYFNGSGISQIHKFQDCGPLSKIAQNHKPGMASFWEEELFTRSIGFAVHSLLSTQHRASAAEAL